MKKPPGAFSSIYQQSRTGTDYYMWRLKVTFKLITWVFIWINYIKAVGLFVIIWGWWTSYHTIDGVVNRCMGKKSIPVLDCSVTVGWLLRPTIVTYLQQVRDVFTTVTYLQQVRDVFTTVTYLQQVRDVFTTVTYLQKRLWSSKQMAPHINLIIIITLLLFSIIIITVKQ